MVKWVKAIEFVEDYRDIGMGRTAGGKANSTDHTITAPLFVRSFTTR